ncbi:MAG TPA: WD40 repeat domain-containing protein, partial [Chryseosolibacter sp.]|nr:WD40 repeat domain-containing protein [Chryseosolibacter sp.]
VRPGHPENVFFSGSGDGMVVRWDLTTPETGQLLARLPNSVYALHFDRASGQLIAGHNYEGIHFLDPETKHENGSLQLTKAAIFDIQGTDGSLLIASGDGSVVKVDIGTRRILKKVQLSDKSARTIAIDPLSGDIAVGFSDCSIRILDADLAVKNSWVAHSNSVFTLRYVPGKRLLLSGARDARLKAWAADSKYGPAGEVVAHLYAINHIEFSPDGKHFVTCSMDKSIKVWDTENLKLLKVIDRARHAGHGTSVNKLLWTSHFDELISASDDRTISVWHIIF